MFMAVHKILKRHNNVLSILSFISFIFFQQKVDGCTRKDIPTSVTDPIIKLMHTIIGNTEGHIHTKA